MDLVAILICTAIAILAGFFILQPFTDFHPERVREVDQELSSKQAEHDRILALIEELEMDHAIGKILDEDYQMERSQLMRQGAENLKAMDVLRERAFSKMEQDERARSLDDELEAAVTQLRQVKGRQGGQFCAHCGAKVLVGDRFCVACGEKLSGNESRR